MKKGNKKCLLYIVILCSFNLFLNAQAVKYSYDPAGNRINRKLYVCPNCPVSGREANNDTTKKTEKLAAQYGVTAYPNPTLDKVNLNITNLPNKEQTDVELVDASGAILLTEKNLQQQNQIDMSSYRQGIYYLRVSVGKDVMLYKIMKVQ